MKCVIGGVADIRANSVTCIHEWRTRRAPRIHRKSQASVSQKQFGKKMKIHEFTGGCVIQIKQDRSSKK